MTAEHDAFLLGRIAGEDALDLQADDRRALMIFKERETELKESLQSSIPGSQDELLREFKSGYDFVLKNHTLPNYRRIPEHGRIRAMKLLRGEPQLEELPAVLSLRPETVTKVHKVLDALPGITMDELVLLSLDAIIVLLEELSGNVIDEALTMDNVSERIADAIVPKVRRA